jgi:hypothetical protein
MQASGYDTSVLYVPVILFAKQHRVCSFHDDRGAQKAIKPQTLSSSICLSHVLSTFIYLDKMRHTAKPNINEVGKDRLPNEYELRDA